MEFVKIVHAVFSKRISKVLFCLLCFLGIGMGAYSQDVIVKKDGEEIKSKVMEEVLSMGPKRLVLTLEQYIVMSLLN